jgi:hypothetical protein
MFDSRYMPVAETIAFVVSGTAPYVISCSSAWTAYGNEGPNPGQGATFNPAGMIGGIPNHLMLELR